MFENIVSLRLMTYGTEDSTISICFNTIRTVNKMNLKGTLGTVYADPEPPKTRPQRTSLRTVLYSFARVLQCNMLSENTDLTCSV